MTRKKVIKTVTKPNYTVQDYKNPPKKDVEGYRRLKTKSGHILNIAILDKKGPRGGKTTVTSLWHPKREWRADHKRKK